MTLTNDSIQQQLTSQFGEGFFTFIEQYGMLSLEAPKDQNLKVLQFLYDEPTLAFRF
jgi:NADH-quinone oxidoreductase subunit C